jgi:hypothetical protein
MARYYTLIETNRGRATRLGDPGGVCIALVSTPQGGIVVEVEADATGVERTRVRLVPSQGRGGFRNLYDGPIGGDEAPRLTDGSTMRLAP